MSRMEGTDLWSYRDESLISGEDLAGFHVEATDGSIGKIDEATYDVGASVPRGDLPHRADRLLRAPPRWHGRASVDKRALSALRHTGGDGLDMTAAPAR